MATHVRRSRDGGSDRSSIVMWRGPAAAVMCGAALALSAYGLGGTAAFAASPTKVTVATSSVPGVGTVLVDAGGTPSTR